MCPPHCQRCGLQGRLSGAPQANLYPLGNRSTALLVYCLDGAVHGELDILGEQVEGPAAVILNDPGGHQEAGARHVAVGAQEHPREVEEAGLPQEPDGITGGDPVGAEVPGVAVAGDSSVVPLSNTLFISDTKLGSTKLSASKIK